MAFAALGVVVVLRHPRPAGFVDLVGLEAGADLGGHGVQLGVDPLPLAVGVGTQIHLRGAPQLRCDGAGS